MPYLLLLLQPYSCIFEGIGTLGWSWELNQGFLHVESVLQSSPRDSIISSKASSAFVVPVSSLQATLAAPKADPTKVHCVSLELHVGGR